MDPATSPPIEPTPVTDPVTDFQEDDKNLIKIDTSSAVETDFIPEEVEGWSWGGFLWSWIWAIGNNTWIGLLAIIPFFTLIIAIILGVKGREWAWKNKKWESVEVFNKVQHNWVKWWLIINIPLLVLFILGVIASIVMITLNPQQQIQLANCVRECRSVDDLQACKEDCKANIQIPNSNNSFSEFVNDEIGTMTLLPVVSSSTPTPKPTVIPTKQSNVIPSPTSTALVESNFVSTGVISLENGVTAVVTSANLSANVVTIKITFKNTSTSSQTANLVRVQMHDQYLGTGNLDNFFNSPLAPNESKTFSMSFDSLPNPPFKIQYAMTNGDLVTFGTYTPK